MEVIFKGTPPEDIWYRGTCINCKTQVRFQAKEAIKQDERNETLHRVTCPTCARAIFGTKETSSSSDYDWRR